ncbi:ogr/Delta-like zinc finger family protein [Dickeya zeae]|uniref:ogr/Delta-like zinc finger family protein n=1 Tax=Dickeya zeae TaxID=204042 RepID=UPI0003610503|nr:ogr/Delta-like zinc finger family protein [Dickeya zeae MS1]
MRVMRVYCPECSSLAVVRKTNRKHPQIADIYCACSNMECGHTFVMNMTFSHTLSPSALTHGRLMKNMIDAIAPDKRQEMIDLLSQAQDDDQKVSKTQGQVSSTAQSRR